MYSEVQVEYVWGRVRSSVLGGAGAGQCMAVWGRGGWDPVDRQTDTTENVTFTLRWQAVITCRKIMANLLIHQH